MGQFYDFVAKHESNLYIATVVSAVLSFVFFIVLLRVAGHTKKSAEQEAAYRALLMLKPDTRE